MHRKKTGNMKWALLTPALLFLFVFMGQNAVKAQTNLENGWKSFNHNDIKKAREYFTSATSDAADQAEAYLMLAVLSTIDQTDEDAFKSFEKFCSVSEDPMPYIESLFLSDIGFNGQGEKTDAQIKLLKKLLDDPRTSGTLKDEIHYVLGHHYAYTQDDKKAMSEYNKIKTLDDWQIVGVFDNISANGFDKDYDPVKYPQKEGGFSNKYGAPVNWFNLKQSRNDKWVDFTYNFNVDDGICFAQTFVNSPSDDEVQFRIGVSGSLKIWINDKMIFAEPEERNNGEDSYIIKTRFKKGYNRVVLQLGSSEISESNFMVRITDEKGNFLSDYTCTSTPQAYSPDPSNTGVLLPNPREAYFQKKIADHPDKLINYLILATNYQNNDKNYEARKLLVKAQELAPQNSYLYYKLIQIYSRDGNKTDMEIAISWLKDNDKDNPLSMILLYSDEFDKENYKGAGEILDKMESTYGKNSFTAEKRIELAVKDGKHDELLNLVLQGYDKYPDIWFFVELKSLIEKSVNKNTAAAERVIKKYLKHHYSTSAYTKLEEYYSDQGDMNSAIDEYEKLVKKVPYATGYLNKLGNIYYGARNYSKAAEYFNKCLEIAPYGTTYWSNLARCYDNMNNTEEAKNAFKKAITYWPANFEARKELRRLENKKDVFDYFEPADVYAIYKKAEDLKYPEDNALILYEEDQKVVYSDGANEEKILLTVKVLNADGVDNWKQYNINTYGSQRLIIEKAEVLKKNGSRVNAETDEGKVVFTNLEVGDAINLVYHTENYAIGKMSPHFTDKWFFEHGLPYLHTKYSLLISPDVKFNTRFSKDTVEPKISTADEFKLYTWSKDDQQGMKSESRMPRMVDVGQVLYISSFPNWTYVSNWYSDLSAIKAKSDFEVKETTAALMKGKENYTDLQKAELIYNYIVKNIRYSSVSFLQNGLIPQKASHVINSKIGDCKDVSTLFVAMCREVNIPAQLVLVDTRDQGAKDMLLPAIDFNHCMAKFTADNKEYFVELTSDYLPFNSFYGSSLNSFVLDVSKQGEKRQAPYYLNPENRKPNIISRVSEVSFKDDDIVIDRMNVRTGSYAAISRSNYRDEGEKERQKEMYKNVADEYANVQLDSLKFTGLESRNDTVTYRYTITGANAITHVGDLALFALPWVDKATSKDFVFENNRKYPMDLNGWDAMEKDFEEVHVKIPAGKTLAEVPKNVTYSCSCADYKVTYKLKNNMLIATRQLKFKTPMISVDKIPEFKEFYKKVITADAKQIGLK